LVNILTLFKKECLMGKAHNTGDYNLFCSGNKVLKNRKGFDEVFGHDKAKEKLYCSCCGTPNADRYHFRDGVYLCTYCAKHNGKVIEERHVP
jgi:hypothetical protein